MDAVLAGYVRALRIAGAEASTAETSDAVRAVALLGYADRDALKAALGATLAKSEAEKRLHERCFDLYFQAPAAAPPAAPASAPVPEPAPASTGDAAVDRVLALATGDVAARQMAMAAAAREAGVDGIRFASQAAYMTQRMLQALGIAPLEARMLQQLGGGSPQAADEARRLAGARDALRREARAVVDHHVELYGKPATEAFMTEVTVQRPLGRMAPAEMERMKAAVARMARRLAAHHARRRRVPLRGQLDMRRTLRANAGHDGVPFTLAHRHRRRDRPRIVAVCDVSGSVAAQVRFLLLFLYALHDVVGELRSFAFSNRLLEVSAPLETLPFDDAMALILQEAGSGSTDYGQAWADLHARHLERIDRRTTLIVLGDGRSNGTEPRLDLFAQLAERAKRVLDYAPSRPGAGATACCCATGPMRA